MTPGREAAPPAGLLRFVSCNALFGSTFPRAVGSYTRRRGKCVAEVSREGVALVVCVELLVVHGPHFAAGGLVEPVESNVFSNERLHESLDDNAHFIR